MKIKCPNCHFENDPTGNANGADFPCESCGKPVKSKANVSTSPPPISLIDGPPPLDQESGSGSNSEPPPIPQSAPSEGREAPGQQIASSFIETTALFTRRILKSNLHSERVSEKEVQTLEANSTPVTSPIAQSYLGWRRALLWFGGVCLTLSTLLSLPDLFELLDARRTPGIVTFISVMLVIAKCAAAVLAIVAALQWNRILRTRSFARLSWICLFFVPLILGLIPMAYFIDGRGSRNEVAMMSIQFGLFYFFILIPPLLGLFPGIVRSALTLKTMLPESQMPGWIALVIAPLYALFLSIGLVIAAQSQDFLISATFVAFTVAPVLVILNGRKLISPSSADQMMTNITDIKRKISIAYAIGLVLSFIVAMRFLNKVDVTFYDVTVFISSLLANLFLVTVVVSDLLITLFKEAYTRENELRENDLLDSLGQRFQSLDEIGLTQLHAGEAELIKNIRNRLGNQGDD